MKKILWLTIFCLTVSINIFGQAKSVTGKEYESINKEILSKTDKKIRRETTVQAIYQNGKVMRMETITQEFLPPDKSKWLILEGVDLRAKSKTEVIYIGDFEYRKENGGAWVKRNLKPKSKSDNEDIGLGGRSNNDSLEITVIVEKTTDKYFLEEVKENDQTFKILTKLSVNEKRNETNEYKIWINNDGLITKKTSNIEIKSARMVLTDVSTIDYNIQKPEIEAPVK